MQAHDHQSTRHEHDAPETGRTERQSPAQQVTRRKRSEWVFFGFLAFSAFVLIAEHRAHLIPYLPWLILLACPLMHVFMHRGHGHGGHSGHQHGTQGHNAKGDGR